jgi:hypothetical protein
MLANIGMGWLFRLFRRRAKGANGEVGIDPGAALGNDVNLP